MKRILIVIILLLSSCEITYDEMSDNRKAIYDSFLEVTYEEFLYSRVDTLTITIKSAFNPYVIYEDYGMYVIKAESANGIVRPELVKSHFPLKILKQKRIYEN